MRRELDRVRRKAEQRAAAEQAFRDAVLAAHRAGASYREIAKATGGRLSHTAVQLIVRREGSNAS
jgi:hypothetical protein